MSKMLSEPSNRSKIKKILVITLSNIGDVILTFPAIDIVRENFPEAKLSVVVGPRAEGLFKGNPYFSKIYVFNKRQDLLTTIKWVLALRGEEFDLVVDFRNTAIPVLIAPKWRTPLIAGNLKQTHMKQKHLNRLKRVFGFSVESKHRYSISPDSEDKRNVDSLIKTQIGQGQKFVVVGPGAANHIKRWRDNGFAAVCDKIILEKKVKVVFVGDKTDEETVQKVLGQMKQNAVNLCGKTSLTELALLMRYTDLVVANDSAIMHLASYLDVPVLAIFGPTDPALYGPWGQEGRFVKSNAFCTACHQSSCRYSHECMDFLQVDQVWEAAKLALR